MTSKSHSHWSDLMRHDASSDIACPKQIRRHVAKRLQQATALLSKVSIRPYVFAAPIYNAHRPLIFKLRGAHFELYCETTEFEAIAKSLASNPTASIRFEMHDATWTKTAHIAWQRWLRIERGMLASAIRWGLR